MKQDLNLLPRREKKPVMGFILPVILFLLLMGAALYAGITIPNNHLAALRQEQSQILSDRSTYNDVTGEFQSQNTELQDLLNKKAAIDQTFDTSHAPTKLFVVIEQSCPVNVELTNMAVNETGIVLQGKATSDSEVAQFMVNLRDSGIFGQTNISYVSPEEFTELPLLEGETQIRLFNLILNYPQAEAEPAKDEGGTQS